MIHGVGTDVVQVSRMEAVWQRHGERFARRTLMPEELIWFARTRNPVRFLAMHFAAKEAIVKALGTGFRFGMWVRDTGFVRSEEHTSELQSHVNLVCRLLLEKKNKIIL